MSRLAARFASLRERSRKGVITYVAAGDPAPEITVALLHALVRAGADVLELGVPFSDPMADGPVIQRASERAIRKGVGLRTTLALAQEFRAGDAHTPLVLMGYANPIERMGATAFVEAAARAGVDGLIVVDYPPQECREFAAMLREREIDPIFLLAPTSTAARISEVAQAGSGFLYYVSLKGITGAGHLDTSEVARRIPEIRAHTALPIAVGFGIRDGESARALSRFADAVVVGSRLIEEMERAGPQGAVAAAAAIVASIRKAVDEGAP
jgi:tryptophan synthase alpha chain